MKLSPSSSTTFVGLVAAAAVATFPFALAGQCRSIVAFGDSLSDTGNGNQIGICTLPQFFCGDRSSNGPVALEYIAEGLGLGPIIPALMPSDPNNPFSPPSPIDGGGNNYAIQGATAANNDDALGVGVDLEMQVNAYLSTLGEQLPAIQPDTLFFLWIGANDLQRTAAGDQTYNPFTMVAAIQTNMQSLIDAGACSFLVLGLPDAGQAPASAADPAGATAFYQFTNSLLVDMLQNLQVPQYNDGCLGVKYIDSFALSQGIPGQFTDPTTPCNLRYQEGSRLQLPYSETDYICEGKAWFDELHVTTASHQIFADLVLEEILDWFPKSGMCGGDPHFQTWSGEFYDYHAQCDLVFLQNSNFGKGLGMNIHIRTKVRYEYSYIESAAIRIGDDVLEVSSFGEYKLNGVSDVDLGAIMMADQYPVRYQQINENRHSFVIELLGDSGGAEETIVITTTKDMVNIKLNNTTMTNFGSSNGLMGNYKTGKKLARDGKTVLEDPNEFGQEWQVSDTEAKLFDVVDRAPQYPQKCVVPFASERKQSSRGRRLGDSMVSEEAARVACANWQEEHKDLCIYDVLATGDLEIAEAGAF